MSAPDDTASNIPPEPISVAEVLPPGTPSLMPTCPAEPAITDAEIGTARHYADASRAASTQRAYNSDWRRFSAWCAARNLDTLPADPRIVAVFLAAEAEAGSAPLTIGRRLAAIGWMHRRAGLQPPQAREGAAAILEVIAGIRRSHGAASVKKHAADADVLRDVLRAIAGDDLRSVRDRALLAFGMAGALRRSESVALRLSDFEWVKEGLRVTIRRGKTDQEEAGATIAIPEGRRLRPKARLDAWVQQAGIAEGYLFRRLVRGKAGDATMSASPMSDRAVARLVQARVLAAGYDPTSFAGHSLRSGFLTAAARSGASIFKMREVSRHKSMQVLADYVRDAELFRNHAGAGFSDANPPRASSPLSPALARTEPAGVVRARGWQMPGLRPAAPDPAPLPAGWALVRRGCRDLAGPPRPSGALARPAGGDPAPHDACRPRCRAPRQRPDQQSAPQSAGAPPAPPHAARPPHHLSQRWITYRRRWALADLFLGVYQTMLQNAEKPPEGGSSKQIGWCPRRMYEPAKADSQGNPPRRPDGIYGFAG